jgi:hypothetical protein
MPVLRRWHPAQVWVVARRRICVSFSGEPGGSAAVIAVRNAGSVNSEYTVSVAPGCETLSNSSNFSPLVIAIVAAELADSAGIWPRNAAWKAGALAWVPVNSSFAGLVLSVTCWNDSVHAPAVGHCLSSWNSRSCHSTLFTNRLVRIWPLRRAAFTRPASP